jgi:hypothetical protein
MVAREGWLQERGKDRTSKMRTLSVVGWYAAMGEKCPSPVCPNVFRENDDTTKAVGLCFWLVVSMTACRNACSGV